MKSDEPSRMALMVARQRAAHQLLDHGAILDDPYAVRILGEREDNIRQAFNDHPLMSMGRLFTAARSRIAEDALSKAVERGVRQIAERMFLSPRTVEKHVASLLAKTGLRRAQLSGYSAGLDG